jgi:hypothetical protein
MRLTFVSTPSYLVSAKGVLAEDEQRAIEQAILKNPEAGSLVSGTGGVRKIRVALEGRGKRGGARVMYYYVACASRVYLLLAYAKNESVNISSAGKTMLKGIVRHIDQEK